MIKRVLSGAVVGALAATSLVLTAAPASASGSITSWDNGASVTFTSYGEVLKVCDIKPDGHSAVGMLTWEAVETYTYWNPDGNDSCRTWNLSFAEGDQISFAACTGEYASGLISSCNWRDDTA
ncbi:MAG TPA: hypothetical protein VFG87_25675 [Amycolatopsis sp.]|jgi:hypothetical protein|nr:hypothetical protein [Amycolatopsis sp.]